MHGAQVFFGGEGGHGWYAVVRPMPLRGCQEKRNQLDQPENWLLRFVEASSELRQIVTEFT